MSGYDEDFYADLVPFSGFGARVKGVVQSGARKSPSGGVHKKNAAQTHVAQKAPKTRLRRLVRVPADVAVPVAPRPVKKRVAKKAAAPAKKKKVAKAAPAKKRKSSYKKTYTKAKLWETRRAARAARVRADPFCRRPFEKLKKKCRVLRKHGDLKRGTRAMVMHGSAHHTAGGLTQTQLTFNRSGRIVSVKRSRGTEKQRAARAAFLRAYASKRFEPGHKPWNKGLKGRFSNKHDKPLSAKKRTAILNAVAARRDPNALRRNKAVRQLRVLAAAAAERNAYRRH